MNDTEKDIKPYTIKVPKGTIVKVDDHPVKLRESLYIKQVDDKTFKIEDHIIMEEENND